jgi:hypothetical protein
MTNEQFDQLLARLDKIAEMQAVLSQAKNMGKYASDQVTERGRILKAQFDGLKIIATPSGPALVSNPIIVDSFRDFTFCYFSNGSPFAALQTIDAFGGWINVQVSGTSHGNANCFRGAFPALRVYSVHSAWPSIDLDNVRFSLIAI